MDKKYGTDGIRNNQAMPEVPKEQWDQGATDGVDEFVAEMMDELEETLFGKENTDVNHKNKQD